MRFSDQVYSADGIRAAVDALNDFGTFTWDEQAVDGYFDVAVEAADDVDGTELEGEFGNFALANSLELANR